MAFSLAKLKSVFAPSREGQLAGSGSLEPEIGFKLAHSPLNGTLKVTVIGARHLPSFFGLNRAHGYLVKVKVFPGESKFETTVQDNSWPVWNEEFKFQLKNDKKAKKTDLQTQFAGHFLSLTIYALLEAPKSDPEKTKASRTLSEKKTAKVSDQEEKPPKTGFFDKKMFSSFKGTKGETSVQQRSLLEKRRTIGAATWNFDFKLFQNDLKNGFIGTPDIWRPISAITTGIPGAETRRENKKGQLEVALLYTSSEDGLNDYVQATVLRMRCSVLTMQEHEQFKAPIYLKAAISEANKSESVWKSDRFAPTISARWDPKTSFVKLNVYKANLDKVTFYFSLGCKNKMGKKEVLGKALVGPNTAAAASWNECVKRPGVSKNVWLNFE